MCGIAGFVGQGNQSDIEQMAAALAHRGPDAEGFWHDIDKGIYLGHKRLSIIDLKDGAQPMWTSDKSLCVIFNGEIYNHFELRKELEQLGCKFQTDHSDTEVLLWGYKVWGRAMPEKLNGMWAFALYDRQKNELFLSRDRFGKKPLFYSLRNGVFAFSSELKSLIRHPSISSNLSIRSLKKYFAYGFIPAPNSLFEHIYKLPAGYNLVLDITQLKFTIRKYWDFIIEPFESIPEHPEEEWGEQLRDLLSKAVKRRLMSDVPLGVFLSGGIDSSSIAAYAADHAGKDRIKTFCIGFMEDSFDESKFSQYAASYVGTDHHLEMFSVENGKSILPEILEKLDEPMGDSSLVPTYLLCRETRKYVTVALGGDGADELFAGYDPFHALKIAQFYESIVPKPIHKAVRMAAALLPASTRNMSFGFRIKRVLRGLSYAPKIRNPVWLGTLEPSELTELFGERIDVEDIYSEAIEYWEDTSHLSLIDKTMQFYTKLYLQDDILVKVDRAGMMNALEVRAPYLDIDLVNFIRKIPAQYKYRKGQTKYILKKALECVLPAKILYRSKHGFGMPVGKWFKDGSLNFSSMSPIPFLNESFLRNYCIDHIEGKEDHRAFLWNYWLLGKNIIP